MYSITIQIRFSLGERVRFDSPTQRCRGSGKIFGVTVYQEGPIDYLIQQDDKPGVQAGILEPEIALAGYEGRATGAVSTLTISTRFTFDDHVRFSSPIQRRNGSGKIVGITIYAEGPIAYLIALEDGQDVQGGILEEEVML
jgi:hypothetical protein